VNIGCGTDVSIKELSELIVNEVGYEGQLVFDTTRPDGTPRKIMDSNKINSLGWKHKIPLNLGLFKTVNEFYKLIQ
jgi:GDP-L-fucose synthase